MRRIRIRRSRKVRRRQNKIRKKTNARQRTNTIRHRKNFLYGNDRGGQRLEDKKGRSRNNPKRKDRKENNGGMDRKRKSGFYSRRKSKRNLRRNGRRKTKKAKEEKEYIDFLEKWAEENGTDLLKARIEDGYQWKDLCKAEIGGKIINEIEGLSMLEEMGDDYNIMDNCNIGYPYLNAQSSLEQGVCI